MAFRVPGVTVARPRGITLLALVPVLFCSCGEVSVQEPPGNGVDRDELVVRVLVPAADSATVTSLGWLGRGIPRAEVWIEQERADYRVGAPQQAITDESGTARFEKLLSGSYRLSALRVLTPDEATRLPGGSSHLRAFGGAVRVSSAGTVDLELAGNRTGLVISEIYSADKPGVGYIWHGYLEIYNNSPETVYLDGRLVGRVHSRSRSTDCAAESQYQNDPAGIWSRLFQRFPGSGTDYPLQPGGVVVIAQDAIDHRAVDPDFPDLTDADFEFRTSSDPDNPAVPDMIDAGTRAALQNGIQFLPGTWPPFLAESINTSGLPRARVLPSIDDQFVQIPGSHVNDVMTWIDGDPTTPTPVCSAALNGVFDRLSFHVVRTSQGYQRSLQRRVIGTAAGGWQILLDTNTSSVDFIEAPRTPFIQPGF